MCHAIPTSGVAPEVPPPRFSDSGVVRDERRRSAPLARGTGDERLVTHATDQDEGHIPRDAPVAAGEDGGEAREVEAEQSHDGGFL
jgi:hypothetical protein